jgi:hypothetical protein
MGMLFRFRIFGLGEPIGIAGDALIFKNLRRSAFTARDPIELGETASAARYAGIVSDESRSEKQRLALPSRLRCS